MHILHTVLNTFSLGADKENLFNNLVRASIIGGHFPFSCDLCVILGVVL